MFFLVAGVWFSNIINLIYIYFIYTLNNFWFFIYFIYFILIFFIFILSYHSIKLYSFTITKNNLVLAKAIDNYSYLYDNLEIDRKKIINDIEERISVEVGYGFVPKNTNIIKYYMEDTFYPKQEFTYFINSKLFFSYLKLKYFKNFDSIKTLNGFFNDYFLSNEKKTLPIFFFPVKDFLIKNKQNITIFYTDPELLTNLNWCSFILNEFSQKHKFLGRKNKDFFNKYLTYWPIRSKKKFDFFILEIILLNEFFLMINQYCLQLTNQNKNFNLNFIVLKALLLDSYELSKNLLFKVHKLIAFHNIVPNQVESFLKIRYSISIEHLNVLASALEEFIEYFVWYSNDYEWNFLQKSVLTSEDLINYITYKNNFIFKNLNFLF